MAIADDKTIVGVSDRAAKARDTISSILERESRPSFGDQMKAATARFRQNIFDASKPTESADEVFQKRIASEISNPAANYKLLSEAAKNGSTRIQALLGTFEKFADTPESMAQLIKAAAEDPQEIDESNAAVWAAKKSQELGLQSYKGAMAKSQLLFAQNKAEQSGTGGQSYDPFSPQNSSTQSLDTSSMPLIEVAPGTVLNPPRDSSTMPKDERDGGMTFDQLYPGFREDVKQIQMNPKTRGMSSAQQFDKLINSDKYIQRGQELNGLQTTLDRIDQVVEASKGKTGRLVGDAWAAADVNVQELSALSSKLAPSQRIAGTGAVSDYDAKELKNASPSPNKRYEVNKNIVSFLRQMAQQESQSRQDLERFQTRFGTVKNFESIYKQYANQNPVLDPSKPGSFELNPNRQDFMTWLDGFFSGQVKVGGNKKQEVGTSATPQKKVVIDIEGNVVE